MAIFILTRYRTNQQRQSDKRRKRAVNVFISLSYATSMFNVLHLFPVYLTFRIFPPL